MCYDNFVRLCNSVKKSPSAVALEIGIAKPTVSRWKTGSVPNRSSLLKVADYFGVSVDSLTKGKKENPATNGDEVLSKKQIEMIEKIKGMSKEEIDKKWAALSAIFDI